MPFYINISKDVSFKHRVALNYVINMYITYLLCCIYRTTVCVRARARSGSVQPFRVHNIFLIQDKNKTQVTYSVTAGSNKRPRKRIQYTVIIKPLSVYCARVVLVSNHTHSRTHRGNAVCGTRLQYTVQFCIHPFDWMVINNTNVLFYRISFVRTTVAALVNKPLMKAKTLTQAGNCKIYFFARKMQ